eukprot:ANDGO_02909.mRNA.1 hypothetical protein PTSG_12209
MAHAVLSDAQIAVDPGQSLRSLLSKFEFADLLEFSALHALDVANEKNKRNLVAQIAAHFPRGLTHGDYSKLDFIAFRDFRVFNKQWKAYSAKKSRSPLFSEKSMQFVAMFETHFTRFITCHMSRSSCCVPDSGLNGLLLRIHVPSTKTTVLLSFIPSTPYVLICVLPAASSAARASAALNGRGAGSLIQTVLSSLSNAFGISELEEMVLFGKDAASLWKLLLSSSQMGLVSSLVAGSAALGNVPTSMIDDGKMNHCYNDAAERQLDGARSSKRLKTAQTQFSVSSAETPVLERVVLRIEKTVAIEVDGKSVLAGLRQMVVDGLINVDEEAKTVRSVWSKLWSSKTNVVAVQNDDEDEEDILLSDDGDNDDEEQHQIGFLDEKSLSSQQPNMLQSNIQQSESQLPTQTQTPMPTLTPIHSPRAALEAAETEIVSQ